jgi:hypothetical protein
MFYDLGKIFEEKIRITIKREMGNIPLQEIAGIGLIRVNNLNINTILQFCHRKDRESQLEAKPVSFPGT